MWCISFHEQVIMLVLVKLTSQNFSTFVHEHLVSDKCLHVYKHVQSSEFCRTSSTQDCFLNSATTRFQVKLKESMYIEWEKPSLNQ